MNPLPLNCPFCNRNISACVYTRIPKNSHPESGHDRYRCRDCDAYFELKFPDNVITSYQFNYSKYTFHFDFYHKVFLLLMIDHYYEDTPMFKHVLQLDFLPNINPQNVKDKLPTILTFL